jgi:AcrR family transcriptional regulator
MSSRDAMIASAATLFRVRGVAATSLRDVVEHARAPRGSIYHHFPGGKAELASAATTMAGDFIEGILVRLLADGDPLAAIDSLVGYWQRTLIEHDFDDGCAVAAAAISSDDTAAARSTAGEIFTRWQERIATSLATHGIADDEAADLAGLAVSAIEGALIVARAQRSTEPLARVARQLRTLLAARL